MHDDGVQHAPDLKRNLILLDILDSYRYRCTFGGGFLKVTKGTWVAMNGKNVESLYRLLGSIIVGTMSTVNSPIVKTEEFGHMGHNHK